VLAGADPRVACEAAAAVHADSLLRARREHAHRASYTLVAEKAFGGCGSGAGQLSAPSGVAIDPRGAS
jgi:hypothetical protein